MRLLATIVLSIIILGGTWLFIDIDSNVRRKPPEVEFASAAAETTIRIVRNFDCQGNADFREDAIKVSFGGNVAYNSQKDLLPAAEPIEFSLEGVEVGRNSFTVFANPAVADDFGDSGPALKAMLVKVLYGGREIAREVFASDDEFDATVGGEVPFFIEGTPEGEGNLH